MEYFAVKGGKPLEGRTVIHGAKNSALPLLAATLLTGGETRLHNCPHLSDIQTAECILRALGCRTAWEGHTLTVDSGCLRCTAVPDDLMGKMRASLLFLGALLGRTGEAVAGFPGGCSLGSRPIDLHLMAFRQLGAEVSDAGERLFCRASRLRGRVISLPFPSVGATENAVLSAVSAEGLTVIEQAAREPEILDLAGFLNAMGGCVSGAGTSRIEIMGKPLHPGEYTVMGDRIVAATYAAAFGATGGEGELVGAEGDHLRPVLDALTAAGCRIYTEPGRIAIAGKVPLAGIGAIRTEPYPGFPTDAGPLMAAALAGGAGKTVLTETVFDRRFRYAEELVRMGADIQIHGQQAVIRGVHPLRGGTGKAADLRGGAALTLAALSAEGESVITDIHHIDRGYENLAEGFAALGGEIIRGSSTEETGKAEDGVHEKKTEKRE